MFGAIDVSVIAALVGIALLVVALEWSGRREARRGGLALSAGRTGGLVGADRRRIAADLAVVEQVAEDSLATDGEASPAGVRTPRPAPVRAGATVSAARPTPC